MEYAGPSTRGRPAVRLIIADDASLIREGLTRLLTDLGLSVVATAASGQELIDATLAHHPDGVIADIRMPPTFTDEGIVAAHRIRDSFPLLPVLLLSNHVELRYATRLLGDQPAGLGYLLKERVSAAGAVVDTMHRLTRGECVVDPSIVSRVLSGRVAGRGLAALSAREIEVLALLAEGRSNHGIAEQLFINQRTVEGHVATIFAKLGIHDQTADNRRVLAVLKYLRG